MPSKNKAKSPLDAKFKSLYSFMFLYVHFLSMSHPFPFYIHAISMSYPYPWHHWILWDKWDNSIDWIDDHKRSHDFLQGYNQGSTRRTTSAWQLEVTKQKCLENACFLTLWIRIRNGWNKECLGGGALPAGRAEMNREAHTH